MAAVKLDENTMLWKIVAHHPASREVLERLGIDYCCHGKRTLQAVAEESGLSFDKLAEAIRQAIASGDDSDPDERDWTTEPLHALIDKIVECHHTYTRDQLKLVDKLLTRVARVHGDKHGDLLAKLRELFNNLAAEIEHHLYQEEAVVFPHIEDALGCMAGGPELQICLGFEETVLQLEHEHEEAGRTLDRMRSLTDNFRPPRDACESFRALYAALEDIEKDLHKHIHLENNILFPRAFELMRNGGCCKNTG